MTNLGEQEQEQEYEVRGAAAARLGWGMSNSSASRRFHYFNAGRSLCGRFVHHALANLEERRFAASVDCAECGERLANAANAANAGQDLQDLRIEQDEVAEAPAPVVKDEIELEQGVLL
jgi:hypothetical protein